MTSTEALTTIDELERRITDWALARDDIRAAIVVGSSARQDQPADELSDLDVGFVVEPPDRYLTSDAWLSDIAPPIVRYKDPSGSTIHVLFDGGLDAGLAFLPLSAFQNALRFLAPVRRRPSLQRVLPFGLGARIDALIGEAAAYYGRGYRVLLDKDRLVGRFMDAFPAPPTIAVPPTQREFTELVSEFWFATVWIAKHARRGEFWWTITGGWNGHITPLILRMIEWRVRAERGWSFDVWSDGRYLEAWAGVALPRLKGTFPDYDGDSVWSALRTSMDAFRAIALDTVERLALEYPSVADEGATALVERLYEGRLASGAG